MHGPSANSTDIMYAMFKYRFSLGCSIEDHREKDANGMMCALLFQLRPAPKRPGAAKNGAGVYSTSLGEIAARNAMGPPVVTGSR